MYIYFYFLVQTKRSPYQESKDELTDQIESVDKDQLSIDNNHTAAPTVIKQGFLVIIIDFYYILEDIILSYKAII